MIQCHCSFVVYAGNIVDLSRFCRNRSLLDSLLYFGFAVCLCGLFIGLSGSFGLF